MSATRLLLPQIAWGSTEAVLLSAAAGLGCSRGLHGCAFLSAAAAARLDVRLRRTAGGKQNTHTCGQVGGQADLKGLHVHPCKGTKQLLKVDAAAGLYIWYT